MGKIIVIGAGQGGLVAAKHLKISGTTWLCMRRKAAKTRRIPGATI